MAEYFKRVKEMTDQEAGVSFREKILSMWEFKIYYYYDLIHGDLTLHSFMPVFHEWFIETFPEPTAWLASRLTYGRTAAVMSMVGFILG